MEVCVDCIASAINAEKGGASRIELCSSLSEGGLTPSVGFLLVVKKKVTIPVFVMIRPRRGSDYNYSREEVEIMKRDIIALRQNGADGFVFGLLTWDRQVDLKNCSRLLQFTDNLPVTFHRAFDVVERPFEALEMIILLGFKRILTSGQQKTARLGVPLITDLMRVAEDRIVIMPGAGITPDNLNYILNETGVSEFHGSAKITHVLYVTEGDEDSEIDSTLSITDEKIVEQMVNMFNEYRRSRLYRQSNPIST